MSNSTPAMIVDRLRLAYGVATDSNLADLLGVDKSTVSGWRSRDSNKPLQYCKLAAENLGVSLDWLVLGTGEMFRQGVSAGRDCPGDNVDVPLLPPRLAALVELLDQIPQDASEAIISDAFARATTAQQIADLRHAFSQIQTDSRRAS